MSTKVTYSLEMYLEQLNNTGKEDVTEEMETMQKKYYLRIPAPS